MTTFSQCYWEDNAGDRHLCPFNDQDTIFLISFAIIMLNTDLHKSTPPVKKSTKPRKKMTKAEFINNLRGVAVSDEVLGKGYIAAIYDSIEASPIELWDDIGAGKYTSSHSSGFSGSSSFAASKSGTMGAGVAGQGTPMHPVNSMLMAMMKNVKKSEEVLRGLSVHEFNLYSIKDFSDSMEYGERSGLLDLTRGTIASTWHHFHALIHDTLEKAHLDTQAITMSLDILKYCLCFSICLDMEMERSAFVSQLARYKTFADHKTGAFTSSTIASYKMEEWYVDLEVSIASGDKASAIQQLQSLFSDLHRTLRIDTKVRKTMARVVSRIRNGQFLLNDLARTSIREGDLMKRSLRVGKTTVYRFFLFSDLLIYAKATGSGDFKIHEELPLHMMKIVDWFPNKQQDNVFQVHHPRKSFAVLCASVEEREGWVTALRGSIDAAARRLAHLEGARMAVSSMKSTE